MGCEALGRGGGSCGFCATHYEAAAAAGGYAGGWRRLYYDEPRVVVAGDGAAADLGQGWVGNDVSGGLWEAEVTELWY